MARYNERQARDACRIYVTDALRLVAEHTARLSQGDYISVRFADTIRPPKAESEAPEQSPEEVTAYMVAKLRGR